MNIEEETFADSKFRRFSVFFLFRKHLCLQNISILVIRKNLCPQNNLESFPFVKNCLSRVAILKIHVLYEVT